MCYIKKEQPDLKSYPFQFRIHMYNLHQKYLTELRNMGYYVSKQVVIKYVNQLATGGSDVFYKLSVALSSYRRFISSE